MNKKTLTLISFALITVMFTGCSGSTNDLPAPYNELYQIQQNTSQRLADTSQQMQKATANSQNIIEQANDLSKFIKQQKEELVNIAAADAESIKMDTIKELDNAKLLANAISSSEKQLIDEPNSETLPKLISGYISRLKTESSKIDELKTQLEKLARPEESV